LSRRAVVVGAGWIARRVHLPALVASPLIDEVVVADVDPVASMQAAAEFDVAVLAIGRTPDRAFAGADLVVVCTPPDSHAEVAIEALNAGADVVVEKPMATTVRDAQRMARAAERSGRALHVCYTNRYRRDVAALTDLTAAGQLGEVREVSARWLRRNGVPGTPGAHDAGVIWDLGSHLADLAAGLVPLGDGASVFAGLEPARPVDVSDAWYQPSGQPSTVRMLRCGFQGSVLTESGAAVHLAASWSCGTVLDRVEVDVVGAVATARLRTTFGFSPDRQRIDGDALTVVDAGTGSSRTVVAGQSREPVEYTDQLQAALHGNPTDRAHVVASLRSVALCAALADSAERGLPARVDLGEPHFSEGVLSVVP
jgi:predicted dehydrogenase